MNLVIEVKRHPVYTHVLLSSEGVPFDEAGGIYPTHLSGGYMTLSLDGESVKLHVMVAETWIENPDNLPLVNHIDGDKLNNRTSNLEWTTYSGNLNHAYSSGLRSDNNVTFVRDLRTGEVREFLSQADAARYFSVNPGKISAYFKSDMRAPYNRYFEIRNDCEWKFELDDTKKYRVSDRKRVVFINNDGSLIVYPNIPAFLRVHTTTVKYATAYIWLTGGRFKKRTGINAILEYDFSGDLTNAEFLNDTSADNRIVPRRKARNVSVTYMVNGVVVSEIFNSIKGFCAAKGFKFTAVQKSVWKKGCYKDYKITYL